MDSPTGSGKQRTTRVSGKPAKTVAGSADLDQEKMKNTMIQDISTQEVIMAIEENFIGFISAYVRTGYGEVYEEPELTWVFTGTPLRFFNGVIRTTLDPSRTDKTIEMVLDFYQSRQQIMTWWVSPLACPCNLMHRLAEHGLMRYTKEVAMAIDLRKINEPLFLLDGLVIEQVQDEQTMQEWVRTNARGFAIDEHALTGYRKLVTNRPPLEHPVGPFYLARLNGEPVATAALYCAAGVAGIYEVCTLLSARQKRIGSAITMALLLDARAMGYRMAILLAESMGASMYQRLGFSTYGTFDACYWKPAM
jgi:GNAT superfamily N-acetyltransferase